MFRSWLVASGRRAKWGQKLKALTRQSDHGRGGGGGGSGYMLDGWLLLVGEPKEVINWPTTEGHAS